jgi:hypothetical protein
MTIKIYRMLLLVFLPLAPTPTILLCRLVAPTQVLAGPGMCRFAFNSYCQQHDQSEESCSFSGLGLITTVDPSVDNCLFALAIRTSVATSFHPNSTCCGY